jgi:hypothetical protein
VERGKLPKRPRGAAPGLYTMMTEKCCGEWATIDKFRYKKCFCLKVYNSLSTLFFFFFFFLIKEGKEKGLQRIFPALNPKEKRKGEQMRMLSNTL